MFLFAVVSVVVIVVVFNSHYVGCPVVSRVTFLRHFK